LTETKHYCDKCGEIILAGRTNYRAKCGPDRFRRPEFDLCPDCLPALFELLDTRPEDCTAPTPRASEHNRLVGNGAGVSQRDRP
jgi:hypothetical protein